MLAVRRVLDIVDDSVINLICIRWNVFEKSASSADRIEVLQLIAILFDGLKDGSLSEWRLIYHVRIFCDLRSIMIDAYAHNFFFILEYADLCRSSTRVDY